jgi:hypothetical protein
MSFIAKLERAREILERHGRLSTRALGRELEAEGDELDELIEELVDVQQVARRDGKVLVWAGTEPALAGRCAWTCTTRNTSIGRSRVSTRFVRRNAATHPPQGSDLRRRGWSC